MSASSFLILGVVLSLAALGCSRTSTADARPPSQAAPVEARVFDASGQLVGPVPVPRVRKSEAEWRAELTPAQYRIVRQAGTEPSFTGALLENKASGVYRCVACDLPLFLSDAKFKSGTGWPSFYETVGSGNVAERVDRGLGMARTEILCARCDGHLGHVFSDGPQPTGLRYCVNSESIAFTPEDELASLADPAAVPEPVAAPAESATAVFAGGCFWCVEAVFEELDGVVEVISGYAGGSAATANYKDVCSGTTGHAEAVRIVYDPSKIAYEDLLRVHFATHDGTQLNRQGNDVGPQYRSAVFFASDLERALAAAMIEELNDQGIFTRPVVTTLERLETFYPAEPYHQNYVCNNPSQSYVRAVALPKVEKVRKKFADRLKRTSPLEGGPR